MVFTAAVLLASIFRSLLPADLSGNESTDYQSFYEPVARSLLAGDGLTLDGHPAVQYPPGWPLVLAAAFGLAERTAASEDVLLTGMILLLTGISGALIYLLAAEIYPPKPALWAGVLWVSYPIFLYNTKQPNSEHLFLVFFFASVLVYFRLLDRPQAGPALLVGVLSGISLLIRPVALGIGILFAFATPLALRGIALRRRLALAGLILTGLLVTIAPWEAWTRANSQANILINYRGLRSVNDGLTFGVYDKDYRERLNLPQDVLDLMQRYLDAVAQGRIVSVGDVAVHLAGELSEHPGTLIKLLAIKALRAWYATDSGRFEGYLIGLQLSYLGASAAGMAAILKESRRKKTQLVILLLLVVYFWLMTTAVLPIVRYMLPAMAILILFIPAAITAFVPNIRKIRSC